MESTFEPCRDFPSNIRVVLARGAAILRSVPREDKVASTLIAYLRNRVISFSHRFEMGHTFSL